MNLKIDIGISSCLVGQKVRFDGNHKLDNYITGTLSEVFDFVPVCPEVGIGLPVPRPTIRLVGVPGEVRAVGVRDPDLDVTDKLHAYGRTTARKLKGLSGYIFKAKSPSCGMERVKIYDGRGGMSTQGVGLYAAEIMAAYPLLPVEEEGRLGDPGLRDNFLERVFTYHRWRQLNEGRLSMRKLIAFHTQHKLSVMAHGTEHYRSLGRLVAAAGTLTIRQAADEYINALMTALRYKATAKRHTNVLHHVMGYLKRDINAGDKQELLEAIEAYRQDQVPRIVPITLLRHHFRNYPNDYIQQQVYLNPSPDELKLRGYY